ncbi:hypothetical protein JTB14_015350 [Gonioctena quinquepunctata]|nr:hypothetical protein JTB14_015350 [Gonioctena quinquepunctata]
MCSNSSGEHMANSINCIEYKKRIEQRHERLAEQSRKISQVVKPTYRPAPPPAMNRWNNPLPGTSRATTRAVAEERLSGKEHMP